MNKNKNLHRAVITGNKIKIMICMQLELLNCIIIIIIDTKLQ